MARVAIAGIPHHVTQRGDRNERVFFSDTGRRYYLELLKSLSDRHGLSILAYCLMDSHLHLVVVPRKKGSLTATLKSVHLRYSQYVRQTRGLKHRLWQGQFYSCPLDERFCREAIKYDERNPVRAGLTRKAERYAWSSAAGHLGKTENMVLAERHRYGRKIRNWARFLGRAQDREVVARLKLHTGTGRPLGDKAFVRRLEKKTGRVLRPGKPGRPKSRK